MRLSIKKVLLICLIVFITVLLFYGFLFGPLFPYSPVKLGFAEEHLERCTIIYPTNTNISPEYASLETLIDETETFHRLKFKKKIHVIVCATNEQCKRFSMAGGHACALQTGTIIYIRPSIHHTVYPPKIEIQDEHLILIQDPDQAPRDLTSFLKHELSHAILYQNTSLMKAFKIKRWLEEGLAVYFGNSHHYYQGTEFKTLAIDRGYFFNLFDENAKPQKIPQEITYFFMYGAFSEFMKYLIETYGLERMLNYTHEYLKAPEHEEQLFRSSFGISPQEALKRFRQSL